MAEGLQQAQQLFASLGAEGDRFAFLITDGEPDDRATAQQAGLALKADGVRLFAIPIATDQSNIQYLNGFCEGVAPIQGSGGIGQAFRDLLSDL